MNKKQDSKMNRTCVLLFLLVAGCFGLSAQQLTTSQAVIDLGQVVYRQPATAEFEVFNDDYRPATIRSVRTACGCATATYSNTSIAPKSKIGLRATYDASQLGHFEKQIAVFAGNEQEPLVLTMKGVVVSEVVDFSGDYPYTIASLRVDNNNVEFDDVNRGDRPVQKIHIKNVSGETLKPQVMHLPPYMKANVSPSTVAPNHDAVVSLTLEARLIRNFGLTQTSIYLGMFPGDRVAPEKEISVSAVLLPDFDRLTEVEKAKVPHISLSTENLNLGSFNGKAKLKGSIEIKNTGRSQLDIRSMQMFTMGLQVSLGKTRIAPGETVKLKVTAIARELKKARSKPRILMITNDPEHPKIVINVSAQ